MTSCHGWTKRSVTGCAAEAKQPTRYKPRRVEGGVCTTQQGLGFHATFWPGAMVHLTDPSSCGRAAAVNLSVLTGRRHCAHHRVQVDSGCPAAEAFQSLPGEDGEELDLRFALVLARFPVKISGHPILTWMVAGPSVHRSDGPGLCSCHRDGSHGRAGGKGNGLPGLIETKLSSP